MVMYFKRYFLASIFSFALLNAESSVGIGINNESIELQGSIDLNAFAYYSDITSYSVDASYLNLEADRKTSDSLTSIGISGENELQGAQGVKLALGGKMVFSKDFMAFPLFAKATFDMPFNGAFPLVTMATSLAYAPPVLSFREAYSYSEFRVEGDMELIPNIHLFTGYRSIDTNYLTYDKVFDKGFYGGMKMKF